MSDGAATVLLIGAGGRMGLALTRLITTGSAPGLRLSGAVDHPDSPLIGVDVGLAAGARELGIPITSDLSAALATQPDIAIDFTFHTASAAIAPQMAQSGVSWVVGTTGLDETEKAAIAQAAETIPVVLASNMSLGVNLLYALIEKAAQALKGNGYDCEIIERHHRRKKDAPSGTALFLGEAAANGFGWDLQDVAIDGRTGIPGERPEKEIGFHAIRGGDFAGDHTVLFAADGECVELSHRATTRETFAHGALRAANWLLSKEPGLYSMRDVLGLNPSPPQ